jgi:hypothetical protein
MTFKQNISWWLWFSRSGRRHATKQDLHNAVEIIMSAISDAVLEIDENNSRTELAVVTLSAEINALKTLILNLRASQDDISPADQALLDAAVARSAAIATSIEALVTVAVPPTP